MSGRGVTDQDLKGLVYFASRLREETHGCGPWDEPGIVVAVAEMRRWNLEVALEQILRRATDPEARTPKAMLHRVTSAALPSEKPKYAGPVKAGEDCPLHVGQRRPPFCSTCATEGREVPQAEPSPTLRPLVEVNPGLAQWVRDRLAATEES